MAKKPPKEEEGKTIKLILQGIYDRLNIIMESQNNTEAKVNELILALAGELKAEKPKATTEKPLKLGGHPVVEDEKITIEYDSRTYEKFVPCKYKCGFWASWANDYKKGDHKLHINPISKEVIGECPNYSDD